MRRAALLAFALAALVAVAAVAVLGARERRSLAFTLGVPSFYVTAELRPSHQACQTPILVPAAFDAVAFQVGTYRRPGPPLRVTVRSATGATVLGRGELRAGYRDNAWHEVAVGHVSAGQEIAVCVRNAGARNAGLYGGPDITARTSNERLDGGATAADLDLTFRRTRPRSTLALVPAMLDRAALFRGSWVGPWLLWTLLACVLLAVPALLGRALWTASRRDSVPPGAD